MDEQEERVVPVSSNVEKSCRKVVREDIVSSVVFEERIADVGLEEEAKVADLVGEALNFETEGKSEVRRPLDGGAVIGSLKEVGDAEGGGVGDIVGGGSGGSFVVEGTEVASVVEKQSLEEEVVKDEDEPQARIVETGAEGHLTVLGSSGGETAAAVAEKGESASSSTFILVEGFDVEARVLEGKHSGYAPEACSDTKVKALGCDGRGRNLSDDAFKIVGSSCETDLLFDEETGSKHTSTVVVEGNTGSTDDEDMTCPNIEGMDTDAYNEKFYFSLEELQETPETATGITENQHNALADQLLPYLPTQVLVQREVSLSVGVLQNSEIDQGIVTEQLLHKNVTRKATDSDQVRTSEEHKSAPQQLKVDAVDGTVERSRNSSLDCATLHQSTEVRHKVAAADRKVSNNTEKKYTRTSRKQQHVLLTSVNDEGAEPQLEADRSSEKNAAHGPVRVESEEARRMESQEQVACPEQFVLEDNYVAENSGVETVCMSSDTTQAIDGGHHPLGNGEASTLGHHESARRDDEMIIDEDFKCAVKDVPETGSGMEQKLIIDNRTEDAKYDESGEGSQMEGDEHDSEREHSDSLEEKSGTQTVNSGIFSEENRASFQLQPDNKGEFCVSDLVWGKVRSHPWWPGQIFDPSDASERAIKYQKKDCFLVGYFGDQTFAWNEASLLKPFRSHFSRAEKQSNSEAFQNAVSCALDEVSRRVELGLSCPCMPSENKRIKFQIVENTGVRSELSTRECVDKSLGVDLFEAEKLVAYMKTLAQSPAAGADKLDIAIAKSQLLAFYCSKGYSELPEFQCFENEDGLQSEDEASAQVSVSSFDGSRTSFGQENSSTQRSSYHKRKHDLRDGGYRRKKEKIMHGSLTESWDSFDDEIDLASPSGKRQKGSESFADDFPEGRRTVSRANVSSSPKPSFKIGECIRRVASQMTGSPSFLKSNSQKQDEGIDGVGDVSDGSLPHSEDSEMKAVSTTMEYSPQRDLLAQLFSAAEHPVGSYSVSNVIISFFSDFRNSVVINPDDKDGRSRELAYMGSSPETFEFEDMSDTYWTDRVIQNGSKEQPPRRGRKRQHQLVLLDADKRPRRSNSKKQHLDDYVDVAVDKPFGYVDENAPAELVMHFPIVDSVPSETNLNRMFRRFGPLKESYTEVDRDTNRARVVFKKCRDAEAAYGSAPKFNIFGQMLVNYHLNYSISVPFKTPTIVTTRGEEDATVFLEY